MRAVLLIVAAAAFLATTSAMPVVDDGEQDSKACAMCELILTRAAALMAGRNFTEQGFEQGLDRLCTKLPPDASKECQQFVALYGEDIFRTLDGEISPQQACTVLRVCNNSTLPIASDDGDDSSAEEEQDQQQVKQSKVKGNPKVCAVCQIILKLVDSYVDTSGMNEDQFEQALDTICTRLPVKIQSECQALVTLYGDQIWQAIDGDVPPAQICAEIGVCPNTTMSSDGGDDSQDTPLAQVPADISNLLLPGQAAVQQIQMAAEAAALAQAAGIVEGKGSEPCAVCELVMRYISKVVQDKQLTEEQFDKDLDTLCSALPANLQQQCQSLVELYGDDLWKAIDGQVPPAQVCTQLHICN